jgi:hypothetical protein
MTLPDYKLVFGNIIVKIVGGDVIEMIPPYVSIID